MNPDIAGGTDGVLRVYDGERLLVELPMEIRGASVVDIVLRATAIFFAL